MAMKTT